MIIRHGQEYNREIWPKRQELGQNKKDRGSFGRLRTGSFDRGFE
jgi:hypothetical protein